MSEKIAAVALLSALVVTMGIVGALENEKISILAGSIIIIGIPAIMLIILAAMRYIYIHSIKTGKKRKSSAA